MNNNSNSDLINFRQSPKRPLLITIVCILGFIGVIFAFAFIVNIDSNTIIKNYFQIKYGPTIIPIMTLVSLLSVVGLIGYWKMKKWGVYIYTIMTIFGIAYEIFIGLPFTFRSFGPIIFTIIGLAYLKKMK